MEEAPLLQLSGDSGNVSQSHSSASGIADEDAAGGEAFGGELLLAAAATDYAAYLLPPPRSGVGSIGQVRGARAGRYPLCARSPLRDTPRPDKFCFDSPAPFSLGSDAGLNTAL